MYIDQIYGFEKGWALKENQKYGKKDSGKHIKKNVKQLLISILLNGNINSHDKLNAQEMHGSLQKFVASREVEKEDVPNVSMIKNWINTIQLSLKSKQRKKKNSTKINKDK
ncbi:33158_t:CDS:2 [Gigaspora margarita]|uniref:33158_t:CDS:1 n=1 Tax=Gigaspora margarita TaxID=4874 RepID=A0ABN7VXY8_GIGMA|nr:33158_t:CDS:2 [Gigaspora margarita]